MRTQLLAGGVMIVRDETERKRVEKQNELLLLELNHRVKNSIAVIQSIAQQSFKSGDLEKGLAAFEGRLLALAAAHSLLTDSDWRVWMLVQYFERLGSVSCFPGHDAAVRNRIHRHHSYKRLIFDDEDFERE